MAKIKEIGVYDMLLEVPEVKQIVQPAIIKEQWEIAIHQGDSKYNSLKVEKINGGWYLTRVTDVNGSIIPITPSAMRAIAQLMERQGFNA